MNNKWEKLLIESRCKIWGLGSDYKKIFIRRTLQNQIKTQQIVYCVSPLFGR